MTHFRPTDAATRRTRNRLREHPSVTVVTEGNCLALENTPALLVECDFCEWVGWLPVNEVWTIPFDTGSSHAVGS